MSRSNNAPDRELAAMGSIMAALAGLDSDSIQRVMDYVIGRLSLVRNRGTSFAAPAALAAVVDLQKSGRQVSIRDLKEEKNPDSVNQMSALVAYYLSELAPDVDRRDEVTATDITKYFKQAGFRLPGRIQQTLANAAAAGYFDSLGSGRYRLNPVGYNLVVHGLPRTGAQSSAKPRSTVRKSKSKSKPKKR